MLQPFDPLALIQEPSPEVASLTERCPDPMPLRYRDGEFLVRAEFVRCHPGLALGIREGS